MADLSHLLAENPAASALMSDREAAEFLGIARSTLWMHVKAGILPGPVKIGHATRWRRDELQAVIDRATAERDASVAA